MTCIPITMAVHREEGGSTCINDPLVSCFAYLARKDTLLVCLVALCQVWWIESIPVMFMAIQGRMGAYHKGRV